MTEEKNSNSLFTDSSFPPDITSIKGSYVSEGETYVLDLENLQNLKSLYSKIIWKRLGEMKGDFKVFGDKFTVDQLMRGNLDNQYFFSTLSILIGNPELIKNNFIDKEISTNGKYRVELLVDSQLKTIEIDDYFPIEKEKEKEKEEEEFCFAKPFEGVIWPLILEKAWAKLNFGYANSIGGKRNGNPGELIKAITRLPVNYIFHERENCNERKLEPKELFDTIDKELKKETIIIGYTIDKPQSNELNPCEGFQVVETASKGETNYLKLYNPLKVCSYKGNLEDKDLKEFNESSKEGYFWLTLDTYFNNFLTTNILYLIKEPKEKVFFVEGDENPPFLYSLEVKKQSRFVFSVDFDKVRYKRLNYPNSKCHPMTLVVARYENNKPEKVYSKYTVSRDIIIADELKEGNYAIWFYISNRKVVKYKFSFSVCSSLLAYNLDFKNFDTKFEFINRLIIEYYEVVHASEIAQEKNNYYSRKDCELIEGIKFYIFKNLTKDSSIKLDFSDRFATGRLLEENNTFNTFFNVLPLECYLSAYFSSLEELQNFTDPKTDFEVIPVQKSVRAPSVLNRLDDTKSQISIMNIQKNEYKITRESGDLTSRSGFSQRNKSRIPSGIPSSFVPREREKEQKSNFISKNGKKNNEEENDISKSSSKKEVKILIKKSGINQESEKSLESLQNQSKLILNNNQQKKSEKEKQKSLENDVSIVNEQICITNEEQKMIKKKQLNGKSKSRCCCCCCCRCCFQ